MSAPLILDPDRFFPPDPAVRAIARTLFAEIERRPMVSPHGHVAPEWFARNQAFEDAVAVFLWPDHYVLRMLYSQGIDLGRLGLAGGEGPVERDGRAIWRLFAANYRLFRGTPSRLWLDHAFATVFGLDRRLDAETADHAFDAVNAALATEAFRPRALFERFGIEVIATTEGAVDELEHHRAIRAIANCRAGLPYGRMAAVVRAWMDWTAKTTGARPDLGDPAMFPPELRAALTETSR